jgi:hypothetical protein
VSDSWGNKLSIEFYICGAKLRVSDALLADFVLLDHKQQFITSWEWGGWGISHDPQVLCSELSAPAWKQAPTARRYLLDVEHFSSHAISAVILR